MKKLFLILFILQFAIFYLQFALPQSLVNNHSFEDTIMCPDNHSQVYNAKWWSSCSSADYYNTCSIEVGIPYNYGFGYQWSATGNAHCGFLSYNGWSYDNREVIEGILSDSLIIGVKYYISMMVNLGNWSNCATDKIGIKVSTTPINYVDSINYNIINNSAHIYTTTIIDDTLNWILITGSIIADSSYKYISIGNFFNNNNTNYHIMDSSGICNAYYFVDDVCVSLDSAICNNVTQIKNINLTSEDIFLYYDYSNNLISLKFKNIEFLNYSNIEMFDIKGIKLNLFKQNINANIIELQLNENISNGLYFFKISTNNCCFFKKIFINN